MDKQTVRHTLDQLAAFLVVFAGIAVWAIVVLGSASRAMSLPSEQAAYPAVSSRIFENSRSSRVCASIFKILVCKWMILDLNL